MNDTAQLQIHSKSCSDVTTTVYDLDRLFQILEGHFKVLGILMVFCRGLTVVISRLETSYYTIMGILPTLLWREGRYRVGMGTCVVFDIAYMS